MKMARIGDFGDTKKPWEVEGVKWREVRLKDLVKKPKGIQRGPWGGQIKKEIFVNSGYPVYEQGNVIRNNFTDFRYFLTKEKFDEFKNYHVKPGDFLITSAGTMGVIREIHDFAPIGVINQALIRIRINKNKIISSYFLLYFNCIIERVKEEYSKGSAMKNLVSVKVLEQLSFIIPFRNGKPDLETQKKIVEYIKANFSRIDKILEKKKKELERLDELWESVLEQAFKPKKGEEWREVRFTDVVDILDKYRIPIKKKDRTGPYSYCGANGIIDFVDGYTHDGEFLLLAEDGGFFGKCEQTAYIMNGKFWANNHVHVLKAKSNINLGFLYYFSIFYDFIPYLRGATRPKLSQSGMRRIEILIPFRNNQPDFEKQKEIANYLDSVYEKIKTLKERIQNQITQLEEMKENILDEMFNHDETK